MPNVVLTNIAAIESQNNNRVEVDSIKATLDGTSTQFDSRYYTEAEMDTQLTTLGTTIKNDILGGAGAAYDTLKELETALTSNDSEIAALTTTIAGKLGKTEKAADSDKLDNLNSSQLLRSDANDEYAGGVLKIRNAAGNKFDVTSANMQSLQIYQPTVNADAFMTFHVSGDYATYFGLDGTTNDLAVGGWSKGATKYKIWHAGNGGSGSGLDADKLDGLQSTQFLRSDTSDVVTAGTLTVGDGTRAETKLIVKASDDNVSDHIQFYNGTTRVGEIGCEDDYLRINQETAKNIYTPRMIRADGGFQVDAKWVVSSDGNNLYENGVPISSKYVPQTSLSRRVEGGNVIFRLA